MKWFAVILSLLAASVHLSAQSGRPPNVLLIMADQWRGCALSFGRNHDADVRTPHLESLASQGIRFDLCCATDPVCTPNRSTLITGQYPSQTHMVKNNLMLPPDIPCLPDVFDRANYATYYCGKWHMDGAARPGYVPQNWRRRGYQTFEGFNRGHLYFNRSVIFTDDGQKMTVPTNNPAGTLDEQLANYEPHREANLAMNFIRANTNRPWLVQLSWGPPHMPYTPPAPFATYVAAKLTERPNNPDRLHMTTLANYYGSCSALDYEVGRIVQLVDDLGLATNTLIVFTSDHGDMLGSHALTYKSKPEAESLRVPLIMRWPGKIPAGQSTDFLISTVDLMPTILSLAGLEIPASCSGRDKSAVALGLPLTETPLFSRNNSGWRAEVKRVKAETYKLVLEAPDAVARPVKFWNITQDPYEMTNLVDQPAVASIREEMQADILKWLKQVDDPWPVSQVTPARAMYSDVPDASIR